MIHVMAQKRRKRKRALKLDIHKANDKVSRQFLEACLLQTGLSHRVTRLIMTLTCVTTVTYQVKINGNYMDMIKPSRGLRQGDPISPYLYLICGEALHIYFEFHQHLGKNVFPKLSPMGERVG